MLGQLFVKSSLALTILRINLVIVRLFNLLLLARICQVKEFGKISIIIAIFAILSDLATLGLSPYFQRESVTRNYDLIGQAITTVQRNIYGYFVILILLFVLLPHILDITSKYIFLIGIFVLIEKLFDLIFGYLLSIRRSRMVLLTISLSYLVNSLFIVLYLNHVNNLINYYFICRFLAALPISYAVLKFLVTKKDFGKLTYPVTNIRHFNVLNTANTMRSADLLIIGIFTNLKEVGVYSASYRLIIPAIVLFNLFGPVFNYFCLGKTVHFLKFLARRIRLFTFILFGLLIICSKYTTAIIHTVLGTNFEGIEFVFTFHLITIPFLLGNFLYANLLLMRRYEYQLSKATVSNTLIFLSFVSLGSIFFGAIGASLGFFCANVLRFQNLSRLVSQF